MSALDRIQRELRRRVGLAAEFLGSRSIETGVQRRMGCTGARSRSAYLRSVKDSPDELAALVEEIVVPETWFFRDGAPFRFLERWTSAQWSGRNDGRTFRALSGGCSTGEEAYSIAATLRGTGLGPDRIDVLGIDISEHALAVARGGSYRKRVLRTGITGSYGGFFSRKADGGIEVSDELKRCVRFRSGNLIDPGLLLGEERFDLIACRNVMIYQDSAARDQVFKIVERWLREDGLLLVGHSEPYRVPRGRFEATGPVNAYAFRRAVESERRSPARRPPVFSPKPLVKIDWLVSDPAPADNRDSLAEARRLADGGLLSEAADLCRRQIEGGTTDAEAYFLLGTIVQAEGRDEEAEGLLQKAVYLDGGHRAALAQLALLVEGRGDSREARVLRRRAERLANREAGA